MKINEKLDKAYKSHLTNDKQKTTSSEDGKISEKNHQTRDFKKKKMIKQQDGTLSGKLLNENDNNKYFDNSRTYFKQDTTENLIKSGISGLKKAAKFLLLLGAEEAAKIMRHLKPDEIEKVSREIASIDRMETSEANQILTEFGKLVQSNTRPVEGGFDTAEKLLTAAFGTERARDVLRKAVPEESKPFQFMMEYDSRTISILFKDESPQVISVVLPYLNPKIAGEVIVKLPDSVRPEIVKRIARLGKLDQNIIHHIEDGFKDKIRRLGSVQTEDLDGKSALAAILRHVDTSTEEILLDHIESDNPELSESIRQKLFTIDDILRVGNRDMQKILKTLDENTIAMLMKGKSPAFRDKIFESVSQNRRILIKEEYEIIGAIPREESERITRNFLEIFKRKFDAGELFLIGDEDLIE